jgi:hypothetical protein
MKKILLAALLPIGAVTLVNAGEAQAVIFNVNGTDYDISSTTTRHDGLVALYAQPPSSISSIFPWFGNETLAKQFAEVVTADLGDQDVGFPAPARYVGALFPHAEPATGFVTAAWYELDEFFSGSGDVSQQRRDLTWAYIEPQTPQAAVLGPLPLLGIGAAFSASRQIRRRIKSRTFAL